MLNPKLIEGITEQLSGILDGKTELPGQKLMKQQVEMLLTSALSQMDLVTRDEFEAQKAVLLRTRERLEALEKKLTELENTD